jgi:lysozyme
MGIDLIKRFEGFSPAPYVCPGGHETIGYGHVIRDREIWDTIDEHTATLLLMQDIAVAESAVSRLITVHLDDCQFDALVSFTYNVGAGALQRSTLRRKANRGDHGLVPRELMRWVNAGGRRMPGLVRRRRAEAKLYEDGKLWT